MIDINLKKNSRLSITTVLVLFPSDKSKISLTLKATTFIVNWYCCDKSKCVSHVHVYSHCLYNVLYIPMQKIPLV